MRNVKGVLYRAKRKDNGEWVKGYYAKVKDYLTDESVSVIFPVDTVRYPHGEFDSHYEIIPETLGRLLGHPCWDSDCTGQDFYQDDIIAVWEFRNRSIENVKPDCIALVIDESTISENGSGMWFPQDTTRVKIIGNAHDNPGLLDGKDLRMFISEIGDRSDRLTDYDSYQSQHRYLTEKYGIHGAHAGCYICNFENDYICHQFNGGCDRIDMCRRMRTDADKKED